ncbi:hypothetical protein [Nocardioides pocheonensis]|nr:hypothetical protein [Nocardioides pocheonensis]
MRTEPHPASIGAMHPVDALHRLGGVATYGALAALTGRRGLEAGMQAGDVVKDARGRYALPAADQAKRAAHALSGVVSHLSAALHWGWEVKTIPTRPHVTIPRNRNLRAAAREVAHPHWARLDAHEVIDGVTTRDRTLVDCLRTLPFDEALAVADSAMRHGDATAAHLGLLAAGLAGPGAERGRKVARCADGAAANPFESVLRAISLDVPGLAFRPQLRITAPGFFARPDLVDPDLRAVAEADSNTWHNGSRAQLRRDCRRYTGLVVRGWWVTRFAWEDVMFEPDYVGRELGLLVTRARERAQPASRRRRPA